MRGEINMHQYRDPTLVRTITLGMRKFGLADEVVEEVAPNQSDAAANLIVATAQSLLEGAHLRGTTLHVDFSTIQHPKTRAYLESPCFKSAQRAITIRFRAARPEAGDPDNRLWRIEFPEAEGQTTTEKTANALHRLFGSEDPLLFAKDKAAIRAASERAHPAFFAKEDQYRKGLVPNERLIIKAPFKVSEGTEYMWLDVVEWKEKVVVCILQNDSAYDPNQRAGERFTIGFDDIYDYVHYLPDGTEEGDETGKVQQQQQRK